MDKHASNMEMFFKLGFKKELEKNGGWRETFGKRVVGVGERLALAAKRAKLRAKSLRGKFTQGATDLKGKIRDALAAKRAKSLRGKFTQGATDLKGKIRDAAKRRLNETRATSAARS